MRRILLALLLLVDATVASARPADPQPPLAGLPTDEEFAGCKKYPSDKRFKLSLRGEVALADLVAVVSEIGCRTIVVGPAVAARGGKVALDVPDAVTAPEVLRIFRSALESMSLTVEKRGRVWKIVDAARAREVSTIDGGGDGEEFVTRLLRVEHAGAADVAEVLGRIKSHDGDVSVYAPGQSIVVTDRAGVVDRMQDLLARLDVEQPGERIWTIATHAAAPTELAAAVDKILDATRHAATDKGAAPRAPGAVALVPVDPARMLVVVGDEAGFRRVQALAARLDPPTGDAGSSQVHVLYLAHTNAEDMVATLREIGITSRGGGAPSRPGAMSTASPIADVRVSADKVSNAVVVFAAGPDFLMVRDLVARLDIPRRQVYVEAAILDMSVDAARTVGVSYHGGHQTSDGTTAFAASGTDSLVTDTASLAALFASGGLTTGVFGQSFSYDGVSVPSFGVVLKALERAKDVHVVSQPHLLTLDNAKASISVGQSIPFPTQTMGAVTGATTPTLLSTYQRQDVALKLGLVPHVTDEQIRLEIDGEISDVPDGQTSQPGGPTTNKRTLQTTVVVADGETVILGGLEKELDSDVIEKVPYLGDLPLVGALFRTKEKQRTRQNLVIALTPYVIRGPEDLRAIFERKVRDQDEFDAVFPDKTWRPTVEWRRKRGLVEEINLTGKRAEAEAELLRAAAEHRTVAPDGEVR